MDDKLIDIIITRMDRLETKVDTLLAFHWKRVGGQIIISAIFSMIFAIIIALIEKA